MLSTSQEREQHRKVKTYVVSTGNGMYFIRARTTRVGEKAGSRGGHMMSKRYMWLCVSGQRVLILFCKAGEPIVKRTQLAMLIYFFYKILRHYEKWIWG